MNLASSSCVRGRRCLPLGLAALACLFIFAGVTAWANPPAGPWTENWKEALAKAKKENKPVLAMFSASWCPPCNMMKKEVFTKPDVQKTLGASWVAVYVDEAKERDLLKQYSIEAFPTFVIFNPQGVEQDRFVGGRPAEDFMNRLASVSKNAAELKKLDAELAKSPKDAALWKKRGDLMAESDRADKALADYKKAQSLDPQGKTGAAAEVYFMETMENVDKDPKAAGEKLVKMEKLYPNSPRLSDALFMRALIALNEGDFDQGKTLLKDYQKRYPQGKYQKHIAGILEKVSEQQSGAAKK